MLRALDLLGQVERSGRASSRSPTSSPLGDPPCTPHTSPYFTPPRSRSRPNTTIQPVDLPLHTQAPRRSKRLEQAHPTPPSTLTSINCKPETLSQYDCTSTASAAFPPTPTSLPKRKTPINRKRKSQIPVDEAITSNPDPHDLVKSNIKATRKRRESPVIAAVQIGAIGKIHLIQETVRDDPWKLLVATCLLNVTSGRAARPIYYELLRRYPNPQAMSQASIPDLSELLYPIGLFNQRAQTLVKFSQQYLTLNWLEMIRRRRDEGLCAGRKRVGREGDDGSDECSNDEGLELGVGSLDVNVFHGAGRYASDSFRMYSDLLPGRGAPEREERWVGKFERARERWVGEVAGGEGYEAEVAVDVVGGYLSDEESVGEEEWRKVRANDKELRRYLIWRWGLEGITYDITRGPLLTRDKDVRRLSWMLSNDTINDK